MRCDFDPLTLLENWQNSGDAPESMPASAPSMPGHEMPICTYPAYAEYTGGDETRAENFRCTQP
ncbi:tannase/feruloyl esterase family alpha/beta hydrolase [Salinicola avicenniae]|uniref:tannase/feruloyl esterase family alpha/beta hydrolase n=1 Tax=Salinicola avicenniae TaxID=2916836 RepID=UPI0035B524DF